MTRGHDCSADHWSLGILIYEMISGTYAAFSCLATFPYHLVCSRNSHINHVSPGDDIRAGENPFYFEGMDQISLFRSIVQDGYAPPNGASRAAKDLISKLLTKDPTQRIGSLARGEREIFEHEWFADFDRHAMKRKELKAPWVPAIKNPFDTSCFDNWDHLVDKTTEDQLPLDAKDAELFKDF
jgi:serine/threonine protein kinase